MVQLGGIRSTSDAPDTNDPHKSGYSAEGKTFGPCQHSLPGQPAGGMYVSMYVLNQGHAAGVGTDASDQQVLRWPIVTEY